MPAVLLCLAAVSVPVGDDLRPLFLAIRNVETGGIDDPSRAVGDQGRSIGPYQITRRFWLDSGVAGGWKLCRGRAYSETVMLSYWKRYCPEALRRGDAQVLARTHNGGPNGPIKRTTRGYWLKVKKQLPRTTPWPQPRLPETTGVCC